MCEVELNKFNFLNEYKPSKGGQLITEQLVPASLDELKFAMEQDKELYTFLNTPAKDLPEHYRFLVDEINNISENETLYNLIAGSISLSQSIISKFSKTGNKFTGFVGYWVNNNKVSEIKMFSFNPSPGAGAILIRDLINLLDELIQKYDSVSWFAVRGNPANKIHQKAIEKYGGYVKDDGSGIRYYIEKNIVN